MVTGHLLPIIFLLSILVLLLLIITFKVNPFLSLLIVSILTGFAVKMPVGEISENIGIGFGNTLKGIGIVIGLGIVLGKILSEAGATETIARLLIEKIGKKNAPVALGFTGLIVSIPVFFDAAFVILVSLAKNIAKISKIPIITLTTSLAIGLIVSHNMIIPTPGPVDVGTSLEVGFGGFASLAILIAVPAVLIGGWLYSLWIGKKDKTLIEEEETDSTSSEIKRPGAFVSFTSLLLPIILILLGSAISFSLPEGSFIKELFEFIGNKNTALLISVFAAMFMLRKYLVKSVNQLIVEAAESSGMILLITGVGGAFGYIVYLSGIGEYIVTTLTGLNISVITTGFLLAAVLRAALGSSTVALVTASTILAPVALQTDVSPLLTAISITLGGLCLSLPNDSGFWVVSRFSGLTITQTLKSWTLGSTIAGVTGFIIVLIINSLI
jgi:gluconate:H+ symporter, GntP family